MTDWYESKARVRALKNLGDENADECVAFLGQVGIDFVVADTNVYDVHPNISGAVIWNPEEWLVVWDRQIARTMTDDMFHARWRKL